MSDEHEDLELVMPFVNVKSVNGVYDDDAYAAGWEAGQFDSALYDDADWSGWWQLRTENMAQADLIAMRHGYRIEEVEQFDDVWSGFNLVKA